VAAGDAAGARADAQAAAGALEATLGVTHPLARQAVAMAR
jgi:hypothetical protein